MLIALFTVALAILFSLFSTAVISYVAMATPIGPWMEMTLVLIGTIILRVFAHRVSLNSQMRSIALATASGGIAGAVATACAFSFPTLYFLDASLFNTLMAHPFYFAALLCALVLGAGSFGFFIAQYCKNRFLVDESMPFPIGQMVYNMIAVQSQFAKAFQLIMGAVSALLYSLLQTFSLFVPARITLLPIVEWGIFSIPPVIARTDIIPMFWAIGFITGQVIAVPLLIAVLAKLLLVDPLHRLFFLNLSYMDYILAFGAGMAIQGALLGFIDFPKIFGKITNFIWFDILRFAQHSPRTDKKPFVLSKKLKVFVSKGLLITLIPILFLSYYSFSFLAQIYLLVFTAISAYQLLIIAGKLGIAPLGRFATFVMIPGLLLFKFNSLQITLLAAFVEIACIVAVDALFGQKVAQLGSINSAKMWRYQWLGLIVSACAIGGIFWLLINHFGLGSAELIASRAQSRAVLIKAYNFNYIVMILGFFFSYSLKLLGINPTLVFGGLLMGLDTSLILIAGGLSTYLVKDKEDHYPFWSGVYATNSLWIFIRMLF